MESVIWFDRFANESHRTKASKTATGTVAIVPN